MACTGVGNLNGNQCSDLVFYMNNDRGATAIYLGSAHPDTLPAYYWHLHDWMVVNCIRDLNGDGYDELVSNAGNGTIQVRFGGANLDSTVDAVLNYVPLTAPDHFYSGGDLNHDGYNDLISLNQDYDPNGSWVTVHLGSNAECPARFHTRLA